jgi:hypothetical protein
MFRVSHRGDGIDDADTIEGARGIVRGQSAGRCDVHVIRGECWPAGFWDRPTGTAKRHEVPGRLEGG